MHTARTHIRLLTGFWLRPKQLGGELTYDYSCTTTGGAHDGAWVYELQARQFLNPPVPAQPAPVDVAASPAADSVGEGQER
ncbi:hypothetical protein [Streptomyces sp. NPDC056463]|uniref:hypothetical protein n=1 Tax=Streptomyces sp. NPDC056463 TaxID=3345827 RepID=UPI0036812388